MSSLKAEKTRRDGAVRETGDDVSRDSFLDGRIVALQPKSGPRAAIDPLFLAAAVPVKPGQRVLEAGTGAGVASLALCRRCANVRVTGIEIQPALARIARENAVLNGFEDRLRIIEESVTSPWSRLEQAGIVRESFEHVAANPPFYNNGSVRKPADEATAKAYAFGPDDLEKWVKFLTTAVSPRGTVTLIHKPEALPELLSAMAGRFGGIRVFPLFPARGAAANRILVQGTKGSRAPLQLLSGMVLHEADGGFTPAANAILRDAEALQLSAC